MSAIAKAAEPAPIYWENEFIHYQRLSAKPMTTDERAKLVEMIREKAEHYRRESRSNLMYLAWSVDDYKKWMRLARSIELTVTPARSIIFDCSQELPNIDRTIKPSHFDNFSFSLSTDQTTAFVFFDNTPGKVYSYSIGEDKKRVFFSKPIGERQRSLISLIYAHVTKTPPLPSNIAFAIPNINSSLTRENIEPLGPFIPHPRFGKLGYGIVGDDPFNQVTHHFEEKSYIVVREYELSTQIERVVAVVQREKFIQECIDEEASSPRAEVIHLDESIVVFRNNELIKTNDFMKDDVLFDEWASSPEGLEQLKSLYISTNLN